MGMPFALELSLQTILIVYMVSSPFLFFLFHKHVLNEEWNNDFADRTTVKIWIWSNIVCAIVSYILQGCNKCS